MGKFSIKIAGKVICVTALFESTRHYCIRYLTEEAPDFSLSVTKQDLEEEQAELLAEAKREGIRPRVFPEPFLERSVIQRKIAEELVDHNILLLHGSTVALDGRAYLFTANCGTGKSTHTRLWRETFGPRAQMVNDDKPFLVISREGVLACGSPWSGKHGLDTNITVPLAGICILERGRENRIWPISPDEALAMLTRQGGVPADPGKLGHYHTLINILSETVPLWRMECTKDPEAARVAQAAMISKHVVIPSQ